MVDIEEKTSLENKVNLLETRVKHLNNELRVTKAEYESTTNSYFDLLSSLEKKVKDRTKELNDAKHILEIKGQELQIMLDLSPAMITYKDREYRYIRVNRKFADFLGIPLKQIIGKTHTELVGADRSSLLHDDTMVFHTGEAIMNETGTIHTLRGRRSIKVDKIPHKNKNGDVISTITFIQDLTDLEKAEKEKEELQERIARAEKMEAIGLLAGGFAHDCNNILGGVMGNIEIALMKSTANNEIKKFLTTSLESADKLAQLVQDLLTMARRGVIKTKVLNVNDVVETFLDSSLFKKIKTHHPDIRIDTRLDPNLMNIIGKQVHLDKTVMNLVTNAVEALPYGGVIEIATENKYLDTPINGYDLNIDEGEYAVLRITDDGTGIAQVDMNRIFEPFYSTKVMGKSGTGLGMSVVYGTIKDHSGFIDVHSKQGAGSTFELYFPITRDDIIPKKTVTPMASYMGNGQKVLVIDDVKTQREIASDILTHLGYKVATVSSGEEAIKYFNRQTADIIILDMIMPPGIDGLDTYRKILQIHPEQKAVIASGFSESNRVKECERLGAGQYVSKPYTFEDIGVAVKKGLNRKVAAKDKTSYTPAPQARSRRMGQTPGDVSYLTDGSLF